MKKRKIKTVDAQEVKNSMLKIAQRIGKRKRIRAGEFFEMLIEAMNE